MTIRERIYQFFFADLDRLSPATGRGKVRRWRFLWIACGVFAVGAGSLLGFLVALLMELPPTSELREYKPSLTTKMMDRNGDVFAQLFEQQRELVPLAKTPKAMVDAFIALEDAHFYRHVGIDFMGIGRAVVMAVWKRQRVGATSTITQQLARNLFLTQERTMTRKVKEALLSLVIERRFRKDEILELYLNQIYFGHGAYGIEAAARTYFGRRATDLSLAECAMLAGIPRSPNDFNPLASYEKALHRKSTVLDRMVKTGKLDAKAADAARLEAPKLSQGSAYLAPYFVEYVRQDLDERYGSNLVNRGGLSVKTTLDLRLQAAAQRAFDEGLAVAEARVRASGLSHDASGTLPPLQGAFVCIDPKTGAILALIGGRNFKDSPFNRAVQAKRQPGSSFKPFVYAAAFDNGFTQSDVILDGAMVFTDTTGKEWKPENFEGKFFGPTLIRDALTFSRNVCTVKLLSKVGPAAVADLARRCGIQSALRNDLSVGLGTSEVTLLEMASAFGVFANGGIRMPAYALAELSDSDGNVREQNAATPREALSPATCYVLVDVMKQVVNRGTATTVRAAGFSRPCAGKTGTTTNFTDAWFVGFTPDLVAGMWIGFDNRKTMGKQMTGGVACGPVWAAFMKEAVKILQLPPRDFRPPEKGVELVEVDALSGLRATDACPNKILAAYLTGTAPTRLWTEAGAATDPNAEEWTVDVQHGDTPIPLPGTPSALVAESPESVSGTASVIAPSLPTPTPTPEFRF